MAQHVLIIQLARFGDLVQTKRLVGSQPEAAEVHLLVDVTLAPLARLIYPKAIVHALIAHAAGQPSPAAALVTANATVLKQLQAHGPFDAVYNLNFSGLNLALARLFDPEVVRGHRCLGSQHLKDPWVELAFRWARTRCATGLNLVDFWAWLHPRPMAPEEVNPVATSRGGGVGVVLAGRQQRRSLPPKVLAPLVQTLWAMEGRRPITLLGTAAEHLFAKELTGYLPSGVAVRNLCGRTDWTQLIDAISSLDRVITPDTGTMHLAAHLGVPVTATFLSSAWCFETGPYGCGHTVWQASLPCSPCLESGPCHHGLACLAPFASDGFRRTLAGAPGGDQPGIAGLTSNVDQLGGIFVPFRGEIAGQSERMAFRALLSRQLLGKPEPLSPLADALYQERDWMLPHPVTHTVP